MSSGLSSPRLVSWVSTPGRRGVAPPVRAFTLLELLLVLALLLTVVGLGLPTLARFFRGRDLDAEALRFLALTRYGQSRAVSEGVPMVLWLDPESRRYGLEAEGSYLETDDLACEFEPAAGLEFEVRQSAAHPQTREPAPELAPSPVRSDSRRPAELRNLFWIRFTPQGFLGESCPEWVLFHQAREGEEPAKIWVGLSRNRLRYEVYDHEPAWWGR